MATTTFHCVQVWQRQYPSTDLNQFFAVSVNNIVMVHQMLWVKFEVYKNLIFLAEAFYFRFEYQVSRIDKKSFW
jgi:hypothetical protein